MAENELQQIVERAVAKVLDQHLPKLQAELVKNVLAELPASVSAPATPSSSGSTASAGGLVQAVAGIHAGTTQKEILKALLDAGSAYAARIALFVVKAGAANGWQCRGFEGDETIKDFSLDLSAGPAAHAYQNRVVTPGNIAEMDSRFVERFGAPENEQVLVLPLVLKDKVAALVFADGGAGGVLDSASLELLVLATSAWLEVASLRKQAQREADSAFERGAERAMERPAAAPVQTVSSFPDPFAAHAPKHTAPPVPEPEPAAEVVEVSAHAAAAGAASAPAAAADPFAGMSAEDADTHRKAQRFARLLVDEIKLYNQAKVAEGRRHKDLYDRLKDDIEKSRATFQKRYGATAAGSGDYFQKEVVRSLAEDDLSVMGASFRK
ncbi:MAG TPA: GAF domain-containing protein [Candidatus Acidoferrales bacterium]|nr:GAF domain-containing protein [Candidatus Acidoferrales bacterium]